jgi:Ca2+-binding EF-hand superfamily protein
MNFDYNSNSNPDSNPNFISNRARFHQFDINGDGRLNKKEFKYLLANFGIVISDSDQVRIRIWVRVYDIDKRCCEP